VDSNYRFRTMGQSRCSPFFVPRGCSNVTTALAWTCYFFGLKHLEPSIVNTVHSGMAPLTVIGLAAGGIRITKQETIGSRHACYAGFTLSLVGLWWVVLSGHSGFQGQSIASNLFGLALLLVSGSSITISLLYSKRLHDHGLSAEGVTAARSLLIIVIATSIEAFNGWPESISAPPELATISVAATILIVLPTFALQIGIAHTASLTAQVIRALGPVCPAFGLRKLRRSLPRFADGASAAGIVPNSRC
jgi:drug/metabolite transporter (DMT)-like permease